MDHSNAERRLRVPLKFVQTPTELPAEADTVVIGGGIVGVCTAYTRLRGD